MDENINLENLSNIFDWKLSFLTNYIAFNKGFSLKMYNLTPRPIPQYCRLTAKITT